MADPKITTEFITTADPKGAQQAAEAIKAVKKEVQDAVPEQEKLKKKTEEATQAEQQSTSEKKNLIDTLRVLRTEFPLVARAIDLIKNPITIAATGVTLLANAWKGWMDSIREREADLQAFERISERLGKFHELAAKMESSKAAFSGALKEIANEANSAANGLERMTKAAERQRRLEEFGADAQLEEDLAKIDEERLPASVATRRRREAEKRAADRKQKAQEAALGGQLTAVDATISQVQAETAGMEAQLGPERAKLQELSEKEARDKELADKTVADTTKQLEELRKKRADAQARLTGLNKAAVDPFGVGAKGTVSPIERAHIAAAERELAEIDSEIGQQEGFASGARGIAVGATGRREAQARVVAGLESGILRNRGALSGLEGRRSDLLGDKEMQERMGPAREQSARAKDLRADTAAETSAAEEARQWFEKYQQLNNAIAEVLRNAKLSTDQMLAQIEELKRQFDRQASQNRLGRE
jgi:hypothetical protein